MKSLKRLCMSAFLLFSGTFIFSQTAQYNELFSKAKEYESQKLWISALGTYWDAVVADIEHSQEAYDRYIEILSEFEKGNPGPGQYKPYTYYQDWNNTLINFDQYFTQNPPYVIEIGRVQFSSFNHEANTADYRAKITLTYSQKFYDIVRAVMGGYTIAYLREKNEVPENLYDGIYERKQITKLLDKSANKRLEYFKQLFGTGFLEIPATQIDTEKENKYLVNNVALYETTENRLFNVVHAFLYNTSEKGKPCYTLYDLKFKLSDSNGEEYESTVTFSPTIPKNDPEDKKSQISDYVYFKNIPFGTMSLIEIGDVAPSLKEINLCYGEGPVNHDAKDDFSFKRGLPHINIPLENCFVFYDGKGSKNKDLYADTFFKWNYDSILEVINSESHRIYDDNGYTETYTYSWANKGLEKDKDSRWLFANRLSQLLGYSLCYDFDGNRLNGSGFKIADEKKFYHVYEYPQAVKNEMLNNAITYAQEVLDYKSRYDAIYKNLPEDKAVLDVIMNSFDSLQKEVDAKGTGKINLQAGRTRYTLITGKTSSSKDDFVDYKLWDIEKENLIKMYEDKAKFNIEKAAGSKELYSELMAKYEEYKLVLTKYPRGETHLKVLKGLADEMKVALNCDNIVILGKTREKIQNAKNDCYLTLDEDVAIVKEDQRRKKRIAEIEAKLEEHETTLEKYKAQVGFTPSYSIVNTSYKNLKKDYKSRNSEDWKLSFDEKVFDFDFTMLDKEMNIIQVENLITAKFNELGIPGEFVTEYKDDNQIRVAFYVGKISSKSPVKGIKNKDVLEFVSLKDLPYSVDYRNPDLLIVYLQEFYQKLTNPDKDGKIYNPRKPDKVWFTIKK